MTTPPEDDVDLDPHVRAIIEAARRDDPSPQVLAALRPKIVTPPSSASGPSGLTLATAGIAVIGVIAGALWWTHEPPPPAPAPPSAPTTTVAAAAPSPPPSPPVSAAPEAVPSEVQQAESPAPSRQDEAAYVENVRRTIARDPARAARLAHRFPALYPDGLLHEEAAALEVEALAASGEHPQAERAAEAFFGRFPTTPYRRRIERALAATGSSLER